MNELKNINDFMENLKDETFELGYPNGWLNVFNKNGKMYAEGRNKDADITAIFAFKNNLDFMELCENILEFEVRICDHCGCPMNAGYTDDDADFYNCESCFEEDMDERYGKGNWRPYEDPTGNGEPNCRGGYYEMFIDGEWEAEPSYYTEWY